MEWSTQFVGRTARRMGITLIPKGAVLLNSQHPILFSRTTIWVITPLHHLGCPHQILEFNITARDKVLGIKQTKANNTIRLLPMRLDPKVLRSPSLLPLISLDICRRMHSVSWPRSKWVWRTMTLFQSLSLSPSPISVTVVCIRFSLTCCEISWLHTKGRCKCSTLSSHSF